MFLLTLIFFIISNSSVLHCYVISNIITIILYLIFKKKTFGLRNILLL